MFTMFFVFYYIFDQINASLTSIKVKCI